MIKNKIALAAMAVALLFTFACEDEDRLPIVVLDTVEKGAYPRLIDETDKLINLFDVPGSSYTYNIEFVDIEGGTLIEEYVLDLVYDDNNPDNGDNSTGPVEFLRFSSSEFSEGENGFLKAPTITITGPEAFAAAGVTEEDVLAGDNFNFVGRIILTDGRVFSQTNSSATVVGPAFRGHFNFTMPAGCPSDLAGTYEFTTAELWCGADPVSGTVEFVDRGGGTFEFSDASFGGYGACYNCCTASGIRFSDVCNEVSFLTFANQYGDTFSFSSEVSGEDWILTWQNDYGEAGVTTMKFPGGVPFTVK